MNSRTIMMVTLKQKIIIVRETIGFQHTPLLDPLINY